MIEQLRLAGDQLRAAWDNYLRVYTIASNSVTQGNLFQSPGYTQELSRQIVAEIEFISSYESKIQEAKYTMGFARNHIRDKYDQPEMIAHQIDAVATFLSSIEQKTQEICCAAPGSHTSSYASCSSPINTLPPEILIRIFHFVSAQPCGLDRLRRNAKANYPRYPDYLAQVCSLWCNIAVSTRSLWCHIDISPYELRYNGLIARLEMQLARAGGMPLHLHIAETNDEYLDSTQVNYHHLYELVSHISSRVETLELSTQGFNHFAHDIFTRLLVCQNSIFTRLVTHPGIKHTDAIIVADSFFPGEPSEEFIRFDVVIGEDQIENSFARLTVLQLHGIFPFWSSKAYRGLVDLRLLSTSPHTPIQETQFRNILQSSPGLQILHFGLNLLNSAPDTARVTPVHLPDLQVVKVFPHHPLEETNLSPSQVIRLLAPGMKPLRLSFEDYYVPSEVLALEMERFFARSRVARFYTRVVFPSMNLLLRHMAHLELVVIDSFESYSQDEVFFIQPQGYWLAPLSPMTALHVTRSVLSERDLRLLVTYCPNQVVLHSCDLITDRIDRIGFDTERLLDDFPTVRASEHATYPWAAPTADWDILD